VILPRTTATVIGVIAAATGWRRGDGLASLASDRGACKRFADHTGWVAEVIDAFAGLDIVEELLIPHGVREMG
jgi:hypothetical protein